MNKKFKKFFACCLVTSMVLTNMLTTAFAAPIKGADRYATAAAIAAAGWTSADTAILVTGANAADALAAAPLAAENDAPILLTGTASLDDYAKKALTDLGVDKVYVVGGEAAVSAAVVDAVKALDIEVVRIKGDDRFGTSVAVAEELADSDTVVLVNGLKSADALSVSAIAAAKGYPILLTAATKVPDSVKSFIGTKDVIVVGGDAVVAPASVAGLDVVKTLKGADRYATNKEIMEYFAADIDFANVFLATGADAGFADALAGSAYAAKLGAPIVLVGSTLDAGVKTFLTGKVTSDSAFTALGGASTVANAATALEEVLNGLTFKVKSVSAVNAIELEVVFTKAVDKDSAQTEANYAVSNKATGGDLTVADATLASDNKTVTLTLDTTDAITEKTQLVVVVSGVELKDDASEVVPNYSTTFTYEDTVDPSITKVTSESSEDYVTTAEVEFSEPVQDTAMVLKVDGVAAEYELADDGYSATLTGLDIETGKSHTLQVLGLKDFADNVVDYTTINFTAVKDTTKPTVTVAAEGDNKINLTFNKKMDVDSVEDYVTVLDEALVDVGSYTVAEVANDTTDTKFVITITDADFYANKSSRTVTVLFGDNTNELLDSLGNEVELQNKTVTLKEDAVAPSITNVTFKKDVNGDITSVVVNVSEGLAADAAVESDTIRVINADGVEQVGFLADSAAVETGDTEVVFPLAGYVLDDADNISSGKYTFYFPVDMLTEDSIAANTTAAKTVTLDFGTSTTARFTIDQADINTEVGLADNEISVDFGVEVKNGTVASNYTLEGKPLPTGTILTMTSDLTTVIIELPATSSVAKDDAEAILRVANVVRKSDNVTLTSFTGYVPLVDNTKPVLQLAALTSFNNTVGSEVATFVLTYDEDMAVVADSDVTAGFEIKVGTTTYNTDDVTFAVEADPVSGKAKQVTLTVNGVTIDTKKTITIKTLTSALMVDASDANNTQKTNVTVTVTK